MKKHIAILLFLITLSVQSQMHDKVKTAIEAAAYLEGHYLSIQKVTAQYPGLLPVALKIESTPKNLLRDSRKNVHHYLKSILGEKTFGLVMDSIVSAGILHHSEPIAELSYARQFLDEARQRIGNPKVCAVKAFAFAESPELELSNGCAREVVFSKSGSQPLTITLPASWKHQADIENNLFYYSSFCGSGNEQFIIDHHPIGESDSISFEAAQLKSMLPPDAVLFRHEYFTVLGKPMVMTESEEFFTSHGKRLKVRILQFMIQHQDFLYRFQGSVGPVSSNVDLAPALKKYEPLFRAIVNSIR